MILVIDSGVWISALQFKGTPLLAAERSLRRHQVAFCESIPIEIRKTLAGKFGWTNPEVDEVFAFYLSEATEVYVPGDLHGVCRDPNDDMVFECAVLAGARVIIAGDKDLLAVGTYEGIRVLRPREFLQLAGSQ